jgi:hypothetical protein
MLRRGGSGGLMRDKLQMRSKAPVEEAAMEKVA